MRSSISSNQERYTHTAEVDRVTAGAIAFRPPVYRGDIALDWIPKRAIIDSDTDLDEIEAGDEITIEIPLRLAREKGLA